MKRTSGEKPEKWCVCFEPTVFASFYSIETRREETNGLANSTDSCHIMHLCKKDSAMTTTMMMLPLLLLASLKSTLAKATHLHQGKSTHTYAQSLVHYTTSEKTLAVVGGKYSAPAQWHTMHDDRVQHECIHHLPHTHLHTHYTMNQKALERRRGSTTTLQREQPW